MTIAILDQLTHAGLTVTVRQDGRLAVSPRSGITSQLDAVIRDHASELRAALSATPSRWTHDPRPDLNDDAALWARLLPLAWGRDGSDRCGVYGSLLGMRCLGVQLVPGGRTLRLHARTGPPGDPPGWVTPEQYREERRRWLDPHREAVIALLEAAGS
ncbi:MAG: hypothetical protein DLM65_08490 [Candidatus Aeolococcus gillhamiae]|uniref:TubC N-terminal docking domain-containing protein n=1 Tax=Candidatus Aeolococcus gillhamiae TaxID=3127015 RepID=A0A2W5Z8I4_9BACT|nr:MAG: hypothetical protein DLM65_08490 [Candidatus Dormibacter sp. RRmetagenome_bin12]